MIENIFLVPHKSNFILYAPLKGIISLVNKEAAKEIVNNLQDAANVHFKEKVSKKQETFNQASLISNLTLILTTACTMRCIYCYADGGGSNKVMSWDLFTEIIEHVIEINRAKSPHKVTNISFHGGDVTAVWPLFKAAVEYIESAFNQVNLPFTISIGMNGAMSKSQLDFIIEHTKNPTVSIDGYADIQNFNRPLVYGADSFTEVDSTLKYFDKNQYAYGLRSTITSKSVSRLDKIIEFFCNNYQARKIMVEPMFPLGRGTKIEAPSPLDFVKNFRKAKKIATGFHRELKYSGARLNITTNSFCKALDNSVVITPDGLISCCYEIIERNGPISDYFIHGYFDRKTKNLKFDSEKQALLQHVITNEKQKCNNCFCKFHCAGDCPVKTVSMTLTNDNNKYDRCYINKELTKDQLLEVLGEEYE